MPGTNGLRTVLIVDDEERLRKALTRSLSQGNCQTLAAASAEEALSLLEDREVDYVMSEHNKDKWNYVFGGQYEFNKNWAIQGQIGSGGSRDQFTFSGSFRW